MKRVQVSVNPMVLRYALLGAGLLILVMLWSGLEDRAKKIQREQVLGANQLAGEYDDAIADLESLPIVYVKSERETERLNVNVADSRIERAFQRPEAMAPDVEVIEDRAIEEESSAAEQIVIPARDVFLAAYRPLVSGLTDRGAVINGTFWRVGERLDAYPVEDDTGAKVVPVLVAVSARGASVKVAGDMVLLEFKAN